MPGAKPHIMHVGFSEAFQGPIDFENYTVTVLLHRYRVERLGEQTLARFARVAVFDTRDPADMEGYESVTDTILALADELAAEFGPPQAVVGLFEHTVHPAALLRDHFGLPGTGAATALLFRDKVAMKQALRGSGVRLPRFWPVGPATTAADLRELADEVDGKVVLKPRGQAASVGVRIFDSASDVLAYAEGVGFQAGYEVEEFIDGEICHTDGVVRDGVVRFLSVSRYLGTCLGFEAEHLPLASVTFDDPAVVARAGRFTAAVLACLGLRDSSFHLEAFLTPAGEFVFLEVGCRFGGAGVPTQLRLVHGFDIVEESVLACLGLPTTRTRPATIVDTPGVGASGWLWMPIAERSAGRVRRIRGLDTCPDSVIFSEVPDIAAVLNQSPGFYAASGKFILAGASTAEVERDMVQLMARYAVEVEVLADSA